jgi:hypothetical protein
MAYTRARFVLLLLRAMLQRGTDDEDARLMQRDRGESRIMTWHRGYGTCPRRR